MIGHGWEDESTRILFYPDLKISFVLKAIVFVMADDQVVEQCHIQQFTSLCDFSGKGDVRFRGNHVSTGVVVTDNHGRCFAAKGFSKNNFVVYHCAGGSAFADMDMSDDPIGTIQENHVEFLMRKIFKILSDVFVSSPAGSNGNS